MTPDHKQIKTSSCAIPFKFLSVLFVCFFAAGIAGAQQPPQLLTYNELVQLYEQKVPPEALQNKLNSLLTTPFVSNAASSRGVQPLVPSSPDLGQFVRVVAWNIERGLEYDAIQSAFTNPTRFAALIDSSLYPRGSAARKEILEQVALMKQADVIVLNEVDWGMKRTEYRNVVADLAAAMGMNYAYGVEFVEVDPIALGIEKFEELPPADAAEVASEIKVDQSRYRGLHGNAILSRFPLKNVKLERFQHQPHDWYKEELESVKPLEKGRRKAGEIAFGEKIQREVRRGGRMMLTAEISDARIPGGAMMVISTHLEDKAKPEGRRKQLEELLALIKETNSPVVMGCDMNTSTHDSTPVSVKRLLMNRLGSKSFWLKQGLGILTGVKLPSLLLTGLNTYRTQADPTVRSVPLVASNPEAEFFDRLKDFRFADGGAFDFRGEADRSTAGKDGPLSNSNQRGDKGFITTSEVERTIGFMGRYKLDWIFVKPPALTDPYAKDASHRFVPHFGRTLRPLNNAIKDRISDHSPLMVDLPLAEPKIPS
ncbi:MAG TPA: endonuclease/exonuclease/phosphatase family protein [Pyrinomonadaceae bacterium]|jgi:endonuclease/exonuclease/phosphatase family metal-dependent hydrolase|nr:endonuclease/exonuclease/phosphatase family protein [Pyrinomonadaceae bacterium]